MIWLTGPRDRSSSACGKWASVSQHHLEVPIAYPGKVHDLFSILRPDPVVSYRYNARLSRLVLKEHGAIPGLIYLPHQMMRCVEHFYVQSYRCLTQYSGIKGSLACPLVNWYLHETLALKHIYAHAWNSGRHPII
jgi:hypothetical protein